MPSMTPCCGASVGALITNDAGALLLLERGWYPMGMAPVAGHDDHEGGGAASVTAEVAEEVGLTVTSQQEVLSGVWLPGLCASPPARLPGHWWTVSEVTVTGELAPDPVETRGARWVGGEELDSLVATTIALAVDEISETTFHEVPGLEPVWIELLHRTGTRLATRRERHLARRLYTTPPTHYWDDVAEREVPVEEYVGCA